MNNWSNVSLGNDNKNSVSDSNNEHPVWIVYDESFIIRVNIHYLEWQQSKLRKLNFLFEYMIAISTSSAVATFWFLQNQIGDMLWKSIGLFAALIAIAKPILNISEEIRKTSELLKDAKTIDHELHKIKLMIKHQQEYTEELKKRLMQIVQQKGNFIKEYKAGRQNRRIENKCYDLAKQELPPQNFFVPEK